MTSQIKKIALQGLPGAYSEQAAQNYFKNIFPISIFSISYQDSFEKLTQSIQNHLADQADYGLLPIENSSAGTVHSALDSLLATENIEIIGETILPVHHALLAKPGVTINQIKTAISHPQALAQCTGFLKTRNIQAQDFFDTAGAAEYLSKQSDPSYLSTAAIASVLCAEKYGLVCLQENIEDLSNNQTRFLVLARVNSLKIFQDPKNLFKSFLVFSLKNKTDTLAKFLILLSNAGINLTKIESQPDRILPFHYQFILELTHKNNLLETLETAQCLLNTCRVFGTWQIK